LVASSYKFCASLLLVGTVVPLVQLRSSPIPLADFVDMLRRPFDLPLESILAASYLGPSYKKMNDTQKKCE
jgi:hypothetical protein